MLGESPVSSSQEPWPNGFVFETGLRLHGPKPFSEASFHPNESGQRGYARLLEDYIASQADADVRLNEGGLPVNPGSSG